MLEDKERKAWRGRIAFLDEITSGPRMISSKGWGTRELPVSLKMQIATAPGHEGAVIVGTVESTWIENNTVWGEGYFDNSPLGEQAHSMLKSGSLRRVSVDLVDYSIDDTGDVIVFTDAKLGGLTMCSESSFGDAIISLVASGAKADSFAMFDFTPEVADCACQFATVIPVEPPVDWFKPRKFNGPTPLVVERNGRVYGHAASWNSCHIGFGGGVCKEVPRPENYRRMNNKSVMCSDGSIVSTGTIVMNTVHAAGNVNADVADAHYADTGLAVADVHVYEDEHGLAYVGALRPSVNAVQVRSFRGSDVSPDWRKMRTVRNPKGKWDLVGLLAVNISGFIDESLTASGAPSDDDIIVSENVRDARVGLDDDDRLLSFVGGNIVFRCQDANVNLERCSTIRKDDDVMSSTDVETVEDVVTDEVTVAVEAAPFTVTDELRQVIRDIVVEALAVGQTATSIVEDVVEDVTDEFSDVESDDKDAVSAQLSAMTDAIAELTARLDLADAKENIKAKFGQRFAR